MTGFDELTVDIAERFELGLKARPLIHEVLGLIAAQARGIDGFLDQVKAAGLEEKEASWFWGPYPMALSAREVEKVLSAEDIERIAKNIGVTQSVAGRALGYVIPKTIVFLVHGDTAPTTFPISSFPSLAGFSLSPAEGFALRREGQIMSRGMKVGGSAAGLRLVVPGAALLITLGLAGYAITSGTVRDQASIPLLNNDQNALVAYFGTGANEANSAIAADDVIGNLSISAGWVQNLRAAFDGARTASFAGGKFKVGRTIPQTDTQLPRFVVVAMTGSGAPDMRIALSTSKSGRGGSESGGALDFPSISFPPDSAKVPSRSIPVLRRIAEQIKQLPAGTVVEIGGYTHGTGRSAASLELAQRRADSVYRILLHDGVSPAMLSAKGYGSASLAGSNGTIEGRSSTMTEGSERNDRRVDFRVIQKAQ